MEALEPLEQRQRTSTLKRKTTIGLPVVNSIEDHRFPLTPEGAGMLVERGFRVLMESGAAEHIHYTDAAYARCGVEICTRTEALGCDMVIYLPMLSVSDALKLRRCAMLFTFVQARPDDRSALAVLLQRRIVTISIERIADEQGNRPFADILSEIDGRAAMAVASSLLADAIHGKGILLGGVTGIVPCEVTIIGSNMTACAAARSAIGLGATVRMFDNNTYRLRKALDMLGPGAIGSSLHPRVLAGALRSADIVIATDTDARDATIDAATVESMKRGVICFDLTGNPGEAFPSLQVVDLDLASPSDNDPSAPGRLCYINAGNAVPRTVAMALTNAFISTLDENMVSDNPRDMNPHSMCISGGIRHGAVFILGRCVDPAVARLLGVRHFDVNLFLGLS